MSDWRTFTVLRLAGDFDPDRVTDQLGLRPDTVQRRGQLRPGPSGRRYEHDYWGLSTAALDEDEIEPHLNWLLDRIEPVAAQLEAIRGAGVSALLDCAWTCMGTGGGPWIQPATMSRLGALDLPLLISFYLHKEAESRETRESIRRQLDP